MRQRFNTSRHRLNENGKLKRGKYYRVGDDGELEAVEEDATRLNTDEKPKQNESRN